MKGVGSPLLTVALVPVVWGLTALGAAALLALVLVDVLTPPEASPGEPGSGKGWPGA